MSYENVSFSDLDRMLKRAPVIGDIHPLVPVCLGAETQIIHNSRDFVGAIDSHAQILSYPALILNSDPMIKQRFRAVRSLDHPPVESINRNMKYHLGYIREHLLTTHKVASLIQDDVASHQYELVVVLLIDGLGYGDVLGWDIGTIRPCFVDGPSITFKVFEDSNELLRSVGFASIVGNPSIAERMYHLGYRNSYGYTYWQAENNLLAGYMFRGVPDNPVINFEAILQLLDKEPVPPRSYVQIVREGLDGLAHSKRELRTSEVQSAIQALRTDVERLVEIIKRKTLSSVIYITADHGILWKNEHDWEMIGVSGSRPRYSTKRPDATHPDCTIRLENSGVPFYLFTYPYLGAPIRKNDSGVHGGFSYQESFVPFIKLEV